MIFDITPKRRKRGRPPLPAAERERRKAEQKERYRRQNEARRRALSILRDRHEAEFNEIYSQQMQQPQIKQPEPAPSERQQPEPAPSAHDLF